MRLPLLMIPFLCCGLTRSPTQGSASLDQTRLAKRSLSKAKAIASLPALPEILAAPPAPRVRYYAVLASNDNGDSGYSNEVSITNESWVLLGWGQVSNADNYTVVTGTNSRNYTANFLAGTNLVLRVPPPRLTNVVITVTGLGTNLSLTNPTGMRLWKGTNMTITRRYQ
jgi:hypothetical protein